MLAKRWHQPSVRSWTPCVTRAPCISAVAVNVAVPEHAPVPTVSKPIATCKAAARSVQVGPAPAPVALAMVSAPWTVVSSGSSSVGVAVHVAS